MFDSVFYTIHVSVWVTLNSWYNFFVVVKLFYSWPQIEEMKDDHEASLMEMETTHDDTLATLQEEHARTVKSKHVKSAAVLDSLTLLQVRRNDHM